MAKETYKNLNGNSGISSYEIGEDSIRVTFVDGSEYLYTHNKPGKAEVEVMKKLAQEGAGLNAYISKNIKKNFEDKFPASAKA